MTALAVVLVADDPRATALVTAALRPWGDALRVIDSPAVAMEDAPAAADVALIDLAVQQGAGLALVHFFRARDPELAIVALTSPDDDESEAVAHALGVNATVSRPLTGDALLVALAPIRERKSARRPRPTAAPGGDAFVDLAPVLMADTPDALASALAAAAMVLTGAPARAVLTEAHEPSATAGELLSEPAARLPLSAHGEALGALELSRAPAAGGAAGLLEQLALAGATAALLLRRTAEATRFDGIKDPATSAYTFAYFVDVAGREIERARRHDRRFALLTFTLENHGDLRELLGGAGAREARRELVDTILDTVRDGDILAHVEDDELYLLLPETGRLGALACRRRIGEKQLRRGELARLEGRVALRVAIGVATFPRDGRDLSSLLRAAQKRAAGPGGATEAMREAGTLDAALGALLRFRTDQGEWHSRQAAFSADVLSQLAGAVAREATRNAALHDGVMYIVGEKAHPLVLGALEAARLGTGVGAAAYWLRPRAAEGRAESSPGARMQPIEIEVDGARVGPFTLLVVLTESWAYACVASAHGEYKRVMHTSDLELVEALAAELQNAFHLQERTE